METTFTWRRVKDGLQAVAEVSFPKNDLGAPDYQESQVVERSLNYLRELPRRPRALLMLLFIFVELFAPLLLLFRPRRFSRLSGEVRTRALHRWSDSGFTLLNLLGDALKAVMTMMYLSHPDVMRYIREYRTCPQPADPLDVDVQPDSLARISAKYEVSHEGEPAT